MFWIALVVCVVGLIISIANYKHTGEYVGSALDIFAVAIIIAFTIVFTCCIVDGIRLDSKNIDLKTIQETNIKNLDVSISVNGETENYIVTYEDGNTKKIEPSKNTTIVFKNINKNSQSNKLGNCSNLENYKHVKVSKKEVFSYSTFTTVTFTQYTFS